MSVPVDPLFVCHCAPESKDKGCYLDACFTTNKKSTVFNEDEYAEEEDKHKFLVCKKKECQAIINIGCFKKAIQYVQKNSTMPCCA